MNKNIVISLLLLAPMFITEVMADCSKLLLAQKITNTDYTFIRKGFGEYGSPRKFGKHTGVDIVLNTREQKQDAYAVYSIASGKVVYSRINGTQTTGFGNVIVIDHQNDCYSMYAHLSNEPFTPMKPGGNLVKKIGDSVNMGELIGYMVNNKADIDSTGNARKTAIEARHQVHFELIQAPSGRKGNGKLKGVIIKNNSERIDPTSILKGLGYSIK